MSVLRNQCTDVATLLSLITLRGFVKIQRWKYSGKYYNVYVNNSQEIMKIIYIQYAVRIMYAGKT